MTPVLGWPLSPPRGAESFNDHWRMSCRVVGMGARLVIGRTGTARMGGTECPEASIGTRRPPRRSPCSVRCSGAGTTCTRAASRVVPRDDRGTPPRARTNGYVVSARSRASDAPTARFAASCRSPTTSCSGTCRDGTMRGCRSWQACIPSCSMRRATSSQSTSTRRVGVRMRSPSCACVALARFTRPSSARAQARVHMSGRSSKRPCRPRWPDGSVRTC
jgi:hypothetical protein